MKTAGILVERASPVENVLDRGRLALLLPAMTSEKDKPASGKKGPTKGAKRQMSDAHNTHHAEQRRKRRDAAQEKRGLYKKGSGQPSRQHAQFGPDDPSRLFLYGLHTVRNALLNPRRKKIALYATPNAIARLDLTEDALASIKLVDTMPRDLDKMVGSDAVHQGCVLEVAPLEARSFSEISTSPLLLVLDQVTDPHNVGAIMRSAVAMDAGALITTSRHSPVETGVLAKSASGALDLIDHIEVRNLAETLEELHRLGYQTIGLDSEGPDILENSVRAEKVALVLGSEGKGLRQKTRETCTTLARVDVPGAIKSLNVSNAAVLSLYILRSKLQG